MELYLPMAKRTKAKISTKKWTVPPFLKELLDARSPSGFEDEAREVVRKRVEKVADSFSVDALGSCHATLGAKGSPTLMLAGHIDELGLMIKDFCILMQLAGMTARSFREEGSIFLPKME